MNAESRTAERRTLAMAASRDRARYLPLHSYWRVLSLSGEYPTAEAQFDAIAFLVQSGLRLTRLADADEWPVDPGAVIEALNRAKDWCKAILGKTDTGSETLCALSEIEQETMWDQYVDLGEHRAGETAWLGDLYLDEQDVVRVTGKLGLETYCWSRQPEPQTTADLVRYSVPTVADTPAIPAEPFPRLPSAVEASSSAPNASILNELPLLTVARYWGRELQLDQHDVLVMLARPVCEWLGLEKEWRDGVVAQGSPRFLPVHGFNEHGPKSEAIREALRKIAWGRGPLRKDAEALLQSVLLWREAFEDWLIRNEKPRPRFWFCPPDTSPPVEQIQGNLQELAEDTQEAISVSVTDGEEHLTPLASSDQPSASAPEGEPSASEPLVVHNYVDCLPNAPSIRRNDWLDVIKKMTSDFWSEFGRCPDEAEAWHRLLTKPPVGFGIVRAADRDGNPCLKLDKDDRRILTRDAFGQRWKRYTGQAKQAASNEKEED